LSTIAAVEDRFEPFYAKTNLEINATFSHNKGVGRDVWAGPLFNVNFTNPGLVSANTPGVLVRKGICDWGEYMAPSGYCERCLGYTYSLDSGLRNKTQCDPAPNNTHAPGGAVFVPNAGFWHSAVTLFDKSPPASVTAVGAAAFYKTALVAVRR